ncbi:MAG TPA: NAD(P)H-dependent oxidoreductase [Candidatus Paceibacterota bacterium]|nr:NAD(P)H-dependent oxidoreductase [Candidatus Paceibacterota bacterium]
MNILAISGSLRKESFNTHLVRALQARAPEGVTVTIADISDVPLYNQDLEAAFPAPVATLKERIQGADGIVIATPEYGRSVPGVLKNVIDWTSRPYGMSAWTGKPVYVLGATDGAVGTAVAQKEVRSDITTAGGIVLGQPEFYLSKFKEKFSEDGTLTDESTGTHIDKALAAFVAFVQKFQ